MIPVRSVEARQIFIIPGMVRVYRGGVGEDLQLAEIECLTAGDLVNKLTTGEGASFGLTHVGRVLDSSTPLATLGLVNDSCLRIYQKTDPGPARVLDQKKLKDIRKFFERSSRSGGAMEMVAFSESMVNNEHMDKVLVEYPILAKYPSHVQLLADYFLLESTFASKEIAKIDAFLSECPEIIDAIFWLINALMGAPFPRRRPEQRRIYLDGYHRMRVEAEHGNAEDGQQQAVRGGGRQRQLGAPRGGAPAPVGPQLFSSDAIANAIQAAMGGPAAGGQGGGGHMFAPPQAAQPMAPGNPVNPPALDPAVTARAAASLAALFGVPAPAAAARPQQQPAQQQNRYADQMAQLRDFGFTDEGVNISVLDSVDGNVESALELLIVMRESDAMEM